jgi:hypothetical protein
MSVIENFNVLSEDELQRFAKELVDKVNKESIFSSETNFTIDEVSAEELTGDLYIALSHEDSIDVVREATWSCGDEEEAYSDPGYDAEYSNNFFDDAKASFNCLTAEIDGYEVSLSIDDVGSEETTEVEVDTISHEDDGIGPYEYGGVRGYDSRPYVEVEGKIICACDFALSLHVSPAK